MNRPYAQIPPGVSLTSKNHLEVLTSLEVRIGAEASRPAYCGRRIAAEIGAGAEIDDPALANLAQFVERQVGEVETATDMLGAIAEERGQIGYRALSPLACDPQARFCRTQTRWSNRAHRARSRLDRRVLVTVGMTYFISALDRADVTQRYVPTLKGLADNIAASVSSLQQ